MSEMFDLGFDDGLEDKNIRFPDDDEYIHGWSVGQEALDNEEDFTMEDY